MVARKTKKSSAKPTRKRKVSPVVRALAEFRRAKGLERNDARFTEVGLTEITLERLESGYNQPNLDTLERYAQAMGFSLALRRTNEEDTAQAGLQLKLPKMRVLAMFNHAGGVGKTSLTRDLAYALGVLGFRVLVIDLDPQSNLSSWLGVPRPIRDEQTVYMTITGEEREASLPEPIHVHGINVIPSNLGLHRIDRGSTSGRRRRLERAIRRLASAEDAGGKDAGSKDSVSKDTNPERRYDFVILDLSPSLTNLTEMAMIAADSLVVPIPASDKGLEAIPGIIEALENARDDANPTLNVAMFVITQFNAQTAIDQAMVEQVRNQTSPIAPVAGPLNSFTIYREAMAANLPIALYQPSHRAVEQIQQVTATLLSIVSPGVPAPLGKAAPPVTSEALS